jgi:HEPN domain-containing protein
MSGRNDADPEAQAAEARLWFAKAEEDLRTAELCLGDAPPLVDQAAFHAQQAAEKPVKGLLIAASRKPPKSHDMAPIVQTAIAAFPSLATDLAGLKLLTPWYVATRYPDIELGGQPLIHEVRDALVALRRLQREAFALTRGR